jgi:hypothetical protein
MLRSGKDSSWIPDLQQKRLIMLMMQEVCEKDVPFDRRCSEDLANSLSDVDVPSSRDCISAGLNIFAIKIRASFGGMKGDIPLMLTALKVWVHRFQGHSVIPACYRRWQQNKYTDITDQRFIIHPSQWNLQRSDRLLKAVDFHCSQMLVDLMDRFEIPVAASQLFAEMMWTRRSSPSSRICGCVPMNPAHHVSQNPKLVQPQDPEWWKLIATIQPGQTMSYLDQYCYNAWFTSKSNAIDAETENKSTSSHSHHQKKRSRHQMLHSGLAALSDKQTSQNIKNLFAGAEAKRSCTTKSVQNDLTSDAILKNVA